MILGIPTDDNGNMAYFSTRALLLFRAMSCIYHELSKIEDLSQGGGQDGLGASLLATLYFGQACGLVWLEIF